jgi:hypothetical protein
MVALGLSTSVFIPVRARPADAQARLIKQQCC